VVSDSEEDARRLALGDMGAAVTEEGEEDGLLVAAGAGPGAPFAVVAALLAQGQRRLKEEGEEPRLLVLEAPLEGGAVRGAQAAAAGTFFSLSLSLI